MELKEFIRGAIEDIASGIKEADAAISDLGGLVNPGTHVVGNSVPVGSGVRIVSPTPEYVAPRTKLCFDIAVSASEKGEMSGRGGAKIWVVQASVGGSKETRVETVSRLSFDVDVVFPHDRDQVTRAGKVQSPAKNG